MKIDMNSERIYFIVKIGLFFTKSVVCQIQFNSDNSYSHYCLNEIMNR